MDGGEEISGGFVVAGGNGSELFEFAEEVFDQMACFGEFLIERARRGIGRGRLRRIGDYRVRLRRHLQVFQEAGS